MPHLLVVLQLSSPSFPSKLASPDQAARRIVNDKRRNLQVAIPASTLNETNGIVGARVEQMDLGRAGVNMRRED
jgi:hypothetical protein